jgi:pimeloyl-ACP methyl ester carboxylesterase
MAKTDRTGALSRRRLLQASAALPLLAGGFAQTARGQTAALPPILFVHGNGDTAPIWTTSLWRMESNGIPRERLAAVNFTDPLARRDDAVPQPNTSSTEDQRRELADAVAALRQRTGADKVALVASSRGGNAVRNYLKSGARDVSHAVLCGVPCHGIFDWDDMAGSEFNARSPFLRRLNDGESEVTPGTDYLTLRSDAFDKYAQPDGRFVGKPGVPTNTAFDGPALRGATNLTLAGRDHREVAFHPLAFREIYRFIAGREPQHLDIVPERAVRLSGLVTGAPGGVPTNRPVADAALAIWRVDPESGARIGAAGILDVRTGADGRWGPVEVSPEWALEFVLTVPGAPVTHTYRAPFPRSSDIVHLRPARPLAPAETAEGCIVRLSRPTGYFGLPRDQVRLDGREPVDVKSGVPTDSTTTVRLAANEAGRTVVGQFNDERIAGRAWPTSENRVSILELSS